MKKILSIMLVAVTALLLVACGKNNDEKLQEAADLLAVPSEVVADFTVDAKAGEATVAWESKNTDVLTVGATANNKVTINVTPPEEDTEVELEATLTINKDKLVKKFTVTVNVLEVVDTEAPVIVIQATETEWVLELNAEKPNWLEGVTAVDNRDGDVEVTVDDSNVDLTKAAQYDLIYRAEDEAGNVATVIVKVLVVDLTAPVIKGTKAEWVLELNAEKPNWLEGVTAVDNRGGDVEVTVDDSNVDLTKAAPYDLVYRAEDEEGNVTTLIVKVLVGDFTAPVISGHREHHLIVNAEKPNWLEGVTAIDDKDPSVDVEVDDSNVDLTQVGIYEVIFKAEDAAGNKAEVIVKVYVTISTTDALRKVDLPGKTYANLTLPTTVGGVAINWSSSNTEALSTTGEVTRQDTTVAVKLLATAIQGENQLVREFWVTVHGNDVNVNGEYNSAFSEIQTLNPLMSTGSADSDVYGLLTSSLFSGDYDWEKAIADGFADFPGDFSKIKSDRNPDGTVDMPSIAYKQTLLMAAEFPYAVNAGTRNTVAGTFGQVIDGEASKNTLDNEWIIELRDDLVFADGTVIDVDVFEYSFQQYLNPKLNNERANYLYNEDYVPLVNGKAYFDGNAEWEDVGFEKIDDLTFKIYLNSNVTQYDLIGSLGIINLVHPASFEAGFDSAGTTNNYGSIENPLVSYGPFTLANNYDATNTFTFTRNETYFAAWDYSIAKINGPIITNQTEIINEFRAGNLDVAGVGGEFWEEFQNHANLYVSPSNSFYRLAISTDRSNGSSGKVTPIMKYADFRKALYLATDREEFANEVQPPSQGALGFLSNIHQVSEWASQAYASSATFRQQLEELGLEPESGGFDSIKAKALFEQAYADAVAAGDYAAGEKVVVEYSFYDAGSNTRIANWVKAQYEEVFGTEKFELKLNALSNDELSAQRAAGDFDLIFTGMSGATFQATFGMGYIFSPTFSSFLVGKGHGIPDKEVTADIFNLFDIIDAKAEADRTDSEKAFHQALDDGTFTGTFDELFNLFSNTGELATDYEGQEEDLTNITAALEKALLEQMIAVPLFSSTSAAVYSDNVVRLAHAYHLFLGWGGLTYTNIKA